MIGIALATSATFTTSLTHVVAPWLMLQQSIVAQL